MSLIINQHYFNCSFYPFFYFINFVLISMSYHMHIFMKRPHIFMEQGEY